LHWNVGGLGAAKHLHSNSRPLTVQIGNAWSIARERTSFRGFRKLENRRKTDCRDAIQNNAVGLTARDREQRRREKVQRLNARGFGGVDCRYDLSWPIDAKNREFDATRARCVL